MLNIVSIDFDIIMAPSIQLYNNMVGDNKWEEEFSNIPQLALSQADLKHYQTITQWLLRNATKMDVENIHFIFDHHHILNFIPKDEKEIIITNIDHHHDICYTEKDSNEKISDERVNCGNWVKKLYDEN